MRFRVVAVLVCLLVACFACCAQQVTPAQRPFFGSQSSVAESVLSPDRLKRVSLRSIRADNDKDFPTLVEVKFADKTLTAKIRFGLNAEVLWSQDSKAFAVSGSSEGANGLYWTNVFLIESNRLVSIPLTETIRRAFGHPVKCGWPEYPNVAAVTWTQLSARLLIAAEIIHHSNCDSFGTFKAYEIDVHNKSIVKIYDQLATKSFFKDELGEELKEAPDNCVRNPKSCYVPYNHPELEHR